MNLVINTEDLALIQSQLKSKPWLVACLCAAWCDTCTSYRIAFEQLAVLHPEVCFAWIDIEDQAHLVDDIDIENFPTVLVQQENTVRFFGTMLPDTMQLHRLLKSLRESNPTSSSANDDSNTSLNQGTPPGWSLRRLILNQD